MGWIFGSRYVDCRLCFQFYILIILLTQSLFRPFYNPIIIWVGFFGSNCLQGLFFQVNPEPEALASWITTVILNPATKIQEILNGKDNTWIKRKYHTNDKCKMRSFNVVLSKLVQIYTTYGFYVKPTTDLKTYCQKVYKWLSSPEIVKQKTLCFNSADVTMKSFTNVPIVMAVISLMIEKGILRRTTNWSNEIDSKFRFRKEGIPYSKLFDLKFDIWVKGKRIGDKEKKTSTFMRNRTLEQVFCALVYGVQKPMFMMKSKTETMESPKVTPLFFDAVNEAVEDVEWKDIIENLEIDKKESRKKNLVKDNGYLTKADIKNVKSFEDPAGTIRYLEEIEKRLLLKAATVRLNLEMLKHVEKDKGWSSAYDPKFLLGPSSKKSDGHSFPHDLIDPIVDDMKKSLISNIREGVETSFHGLQDYEMLWDSLIDPDPEPAPESNPKEDKNHESAPESGSEEDPSVFDLPIPRDPKKVALRRQIEMHDAAARKNEAAALKTIKSKSGSLSSSSKLVRKNDESSEDEAGTLNSLKFPVEELGTQDLSDSDSVKKLRFEDCDSVQTTTTPNKGSNNLEDNDDDDGGGKRSSRKMDSSGGATDSFATKFPLTESDKRMASGKQETPKVEKRRRQPPPSGTMESLKKPRTQQTTNDSNQGDGSGNDSDSSESHESPNRRSSRIQTHDQSAASPESPTRGRKSDHSPEASPTRRSTRKHNS
jgi:hypothetical protein